MNEIIVAIIGSGALGAVAGAAVSWLLNYKLFDAKVEYTAAETADIAVQTYRNLVTDLRVRIDELESARKRSIEKFAELESEIAELRRDRRISQGRTRMMARVLVVILNLLNGKVNASLCNIADDANISADDIEFLKHIMDEVISEVDLTDAGATARQ